MQMIDILLKYIPNLIWNIKQFEAQMDLDEHFVTKKPVKKNHSNLKYALASCELNDSSLYQNELEMTGHLLHIFRSW